MHACCAGRAKWWEHVLGMVPKTNLPRELGPEHNVTLEAFAHTACLVRMQPLLLGLLEQPESAVSLAHI